MDCSVGVKVKGVRMVMKFETSMFKKEMSDVSEMMTEYTREHVEYLSEKYSFKLEEALKFLNIEKKEERKEEKKEIQKGKNQILLPFCGVINNHWCNGVRLNYGLYTQCTNDKDKKRGFCKTCLKQGEKNGTGNPTYGTIQERAKAGNDFRDPKGKPSVRYANIMEKFNISKEDAINAAADLGLVIPDEELELKVVKRGRPKKSVAVSDTDSEASAPAQKKRGRPRKDKTIVSELATGDDLIAGLIKEAKQEVAKPTKSEPEKKNEPEITPDAVESDDEEEEVEVVKFTDPKTGIEYYKTEQNILYSMDSEPVGRWNPETQTIETDLFDLDEDDD